MDCRVLRLAVGRFRVHAFPLEDVPGGDPLLQQLVSDTAGGPQAFRRRQGMLQERATPVMLQRESVGTNGLAIDAGDTFNLALGGTSAQQRTDRGLQVWFQDVHSSFPLGDEGVESNILLALAWAGDGAPWAPQSSVARVGEFGWP